MASKIYTAQELRQTAQGLFARGVVATVPANVKYGRREKEVYADQLKEMLLQAADALEREKRVKKLEKREYAVKWLDENSVANNMGERRDFAESVVRAVGESKAQLVSREVGEWEVCK